MVVNAEHVRSLTLYHLEDATVESLREAAAQYDDYVARGKTMPHPTTGENVSAETIGELARALRERAETGDLEPPDYA